MKDNSQKSLMSPYYPPEMQEMCVSLVNCLAVSGEAEHEGYISEDLFD
ncbi:MAG: hypothetical protein J5771_05665 [Bacteroidales bacterium]|nr:hypothetical protein [Bacteroidales bacterium]